MSSTLGTPGRSPRLSIGLEAVSKDGGSVVAAAAGLLAGAGICLMEAVTVTTSSDGGSATNLVGGALCTEGTAAAIWGKGGSRCGCCCCCFLAAAVCLSRSFNVLPPVVIGGSAGVSTAATLTVSGSSIVSWTGSGTCVATLACTPPGNPGSLAGPKGGDRPGRSPPCLQTVPEPYVLPPSDLFQKPLPGLPPPRV